jgi:hypothetical protein
MQDNFAARASFVASGASESGMTPDPARARVTARQKSGNELPN